MKRFRSQPLLKLSSWKLRSKPCEKLASDLPKAVGSAVSILGALVVGQAAVQAGIVSAPMVIVVSITGIASFTIPRFNGAIAIRMLRFPILIAASVIRFLRHLFLAHDFDRTYGEFAFLRSSLFITDWDHYPLEI